MGGVLNLQPLSKFLIQHMARRYLGAFGDQGCQGQNWQSARCGNREQERASCWFVLLDYWIERMRMARACEVIEKTLLEMNYENVLYA
jgi:hypothetical protein